MHVQSLRHVPGGIQTHSHSTKLKWTRLVRVRLSRATRIQVQKLKNKNIGRLKCETCWALDAIGGFVLAINRAQISTRKKCGNLTLKTKLKNHLLYQALYTTTAAIERQILVHCPHHCSKHREAARHIIPYHTCLSSTTSSSLPLSSESNTVHAEGLRAARWGFACDISRAQQQQKNRNV